MVYQCIPAAPSSQAYCKEPLTLCHASTPARNLHAFVVETSVNCQAALTTKILHPLLTQTHSNQGSRCYGSNISTHGSGTPISLGNPSLRPKSFLFTASLVVKGMVRRFFCSHVAPNVGVRPWLIEHQGKAHVVSLLESTSPRNFSLRKAVFRPWTVHLRSQVAEAPHVPNEFHMRPQYDNEDPRGL